MSDNQKLLPTVHHVWCNGDSRAPVKGCRWCDRGDGTGLWHQYGYETAEEMSGLMAKHFPQNIAIPGTGPSAEWTEAHIRAVRDTSGDTKHE